MQVRFAASVLAATISAALFVPITASADIDFTSVSFGFRDDDFTAGIGASSGVITSLYASGATGGLTQHSMSFNFNPQTGASLPSGVWYWSDTSGTNTIFGTYTTTTYATGPAALLLASPRGTMQIQGGTGYYAGATGGGTFEQFQIVTAFDGTNALSYQEIAVERLQIGGLSPQEVAVAPPVDTRDVTVSINQGTNSASTGSNSGYITSVTPGTLPPLQYHEAHFTLTPGAPYSQPIDGTYRASDDAGNELRGSFHEDTPGDSYGYWYHAVGKSKVTGGTGAYADMAGGDDYEYFWLQTGGDPSLGTTDYLQVTIGRGTLSPAPEPGTYALMGVGLALLGIAQRRRAR